LGIESLHLGFGDAGGEEKLDLAAGEVGPVLLRDVEHAAPNLPYLTAERVAQPGEAVAVIATGGGELVKEEDDVLAVGSGQTLDIHTAALFLGGVGAGSEGLFEGLGVVARAGNARPEATNLVGEKEQGVAITARMIRISAIMLLCIGFEGEAAILDAVSVPPEGFVEDQRVGADVVDNARAAEGQSGQTEE